MLEYTPEQIEQAKKEAQLLVDIYDSAHGQIFFCTDDGKKHDIGAIVKTILAALEATEKERDDGEKMFQALKAALLKRTTYAAKLEKAGDAISKFFPNNSDYVCSCCFCTAKSAWEAARKEKPGA
jgi:hypothetical protein